MASDTRLLEKLGAVAPVEPTARIGFMNASARDNSAPLVTPSADMAASA